MNRAVVFLLLPWLVGCSHEESIEWQQMRRTVLVYLAGDNSLSSEVVAKRTALVRAWRSEIEGRLLIFTDRKGSAPVLEQVSERNGLPVADTLR
ncbi:MAG TPA: clostripain, partial [Dysgonamonadaceae bacterium]|nr:clostripain [Dysgonamonadaceae bacterium]